MVWRKREKQRTSVGRLLHGVTIPRSKEGVVRETVKKRSLFHDLVYRVFNRRGIFHVGQWVEIERNYCDIVGELFWWRVKGRRRRRRMGSGSTYLRISSRNKVNRSDRGLTKRWTPIRIGENRSRDDIIPEKFARSPSLVSDHEALFSASLDFENLHHGTITRFYLPENVLIDFESVFGRLLEENRVGNGSDVGFPVKRLGWSERQKGRGGEARLTRPCGWRGGWDWGNYTC